MDIGVVDAPYLFVPDLPRVSWGFYYLTRTRVEKIHSQRDFDILG
jgi:hypothetical protein